MSIKTKLLIILGPTASGKTSLSIRLAKKFNGEIISADSRQVYKGMDIGSGKVTIKEMQDIKHYLLDEVKPMTNFNVNHFIKKATKAIKIIQSKDKLPIIAGGTMFWVDALLYGLPITVKPDQKLRARLEKESTQQLYQKLKKLDPRRAKEIDPDNKRRLIRALEIVMITGQPVPVYKKEAQYDCLKIGVKRSKDELNKRIHIRLYERMKQGMVAEVKNLHQQGVTWKRLENFGLEYRYISKYLKGELTKDQMLQLLESEIKKYAKRQMTWFKKDQSIFWSNNYSDISKKIKSWLLDK